MACRDLEKRRKSQREYQARLRAKKRAEKEAGLTPDPVSPPSPHHGPVDPAVLRLPSELPKTADGILLALRAGLAALPHISIHSAGERHRLLQGYLTLYVKVVKGVILEEDAKRALDQATATIDEYQRQFGVTDA